MTENIQAEQWLVEQRTRELTAVSKATLKRTLVKLAIFAAVMVLNDIFFSRFVVWLFVMCGAAELPYDALYLVNWILNDICVYLLPATSLMVIFRRELREKVACIRYHDYKWGRELICCFSAMLFAGSMASIITNIIASILDSLFGTGEIEDAMAGVAPENDVNFLVFFIFICAIGPVCEEIIFRHLMLKPLRRCGDGVAVLITAFLFGVYHGNFDQFPYAFAVGIFLGLIAVRSNSLLPSTILHVVNNTMVAFGQYLSDALGENDVTLAVESGINIAYSLLYYAGIAGFVVLLVSKKFKFYNYGLPLKWKNKLKISFCHPATYIAIALAAVMFIY